MGICLKKHLHSNGFTHSSVKSIASKAKKMKYLMEWSEHSGFLFVDLVIVNKHLLNFTSYD
jgi:hypothetical protein